MRWKIELYIGSFPFTVVHVISRFVAGTEFRLNECSYLFIIINLNGDGRKSIRRN